MSEEERYRAALEHGAEDLQIELWPELVEGMTTHYGLMCRWAKKLNLTAILDPEEAASLHGLDCLLLTRLIPKGDQSRAVDIGSGAGYPGVVLALARPELSLTLIEPQRKRASFLRVVLAELGVSGVSVKEARVGDDRREASLDVDYLLSRATLPPPKLLEVAARHLAQAGRLILMRGRPSEPDDVEHGRTLHLERIESIEAVLPGGAPRVLEVYARSSTS